VAELRNALDDPERRVESIEAYQRATQELDRLQSLMDSALSVEDVPDDPRVVELGDTVVIELESGLRETYIIVHGAEAPVDDRRISVESPLGRALLARHVGEVVEVTVPEGSYRCTIRSATRGRGARRDKRPGDPVDAPHRQSRPSPGTADASAVLKARAACVRVAGC